MSVYVNKNKVCFIMGNGPSAKSFSFEQLNQLNTFGMNAAYRYWHKIKRYPKFYSCLDLVVGLSHIEAISELIINSNDYGIEKFLLRKNLVDKIGQITNHKKISVLEDLVENKDLLISKTMPRITTGAGTAAWAIDLGFQDIYLYGIDINYIEKQNFLKKIDHENSKWAIEVTEDFENPNYFFKDYNRKGDKLNIPNPNINDPVHLDSWVKLKKLTNNKVRIFNSSEKSQLKIFPYKNFFLNSAYYLQCYDYENVQVSEINIIYKIIKNHYVNINKKDKYIFDIGSFNGRSIKKFADDGWLINAFEPSEKNWYMNERTLGKYKNVKRYKLAISDKNLKESTFYESDESKGISSLLKFTNQHVKTKYKVEVRTLEKHCELHSIENIFFLKIDAEGYDLNVLRGNNWKKINPEIILCEYENNKTKLLNYNTQDIISYLIEKKYNVYISEWHPIKKYGIQHCWKSINKSPYLPESDTWGNILAFKDNKISQEIIYKFFLDEVKLSKKERVLMPNNDKKERVLMPNNEMKRTYLKTSFLRKIQHFFAVNKNIFLVSAVVNILFISTIFFVRNLFSNEFLFLTIVSIFYFSLIAIYLIHSSKKIRSNIFNIYELTKKSDELTKKSDELTKELTKKSDELTKKSDELTKKTDELTKKSEEIFKINKIYGHNRILKDTEVLSAINELNNIIDINKSKTKQFLFVANKFVEQEKHLIGRIACSIENLLFRYIFLQSFNQKTIKVLEIGTLFGISIQLIIKELNLANIEVFTDIIDPLNGFYSQEFDKLTGYNVSPKIFEENLKKVNIEKNKINLIKEYSTNKKINFKYNPYDAIIIDGDHTYTGIKNDFELSNIHLKKNGILIIDDYKNTNWPGVSSFVEKELLINKNYLKIFDNFNLIVFKKLHE